MSVQKKRIISIFTFFLILIAFFNINSELSYTEVGEDISVSLDDDWTIISDDFCFEKANISETVFTQRKKGDMITYFSVLPQTDIPNPILVLYTIHEDIEVFLDDVTKSGAEAALQIPINIVKSSGYDLVRAILDPEEAAMQTAEHGAYELTMKETMLSEDGEVL